MGKLLGLVDKVLSTAAGAKQDKCQVLCLGDIEGEHATGEASRVEHDSVIAGVDVADRAG